MDSASRNRTVWAIGGVIALLLCGVVSPAFGQKFARARSVASDDSETESTGSSMASRSIRSRLISPGGNAAATRSPITAAPMAEPHFLRSPFAASSTPRGAGGRRFAPGWQTMDSLPTNTTPRGRVIRHVPGTPLDPQEGDIIYEEPDFNHVPSAPPTTAHSAPRTTRRSSKYHPVTVKQRGGVSGAEPIGAGQPTLAPGARSLVQGEGSEAPVMDGSIVEEGTLVEGDDGDIIYEDGGFGCGGDCDDCSSCHYSQWGPKYYDDPTPHRIVPCDGICIPRHWVDETALFLGVQGFTNPTDRGLPPSFPTDNGNFGYHEGVNFAGHFGRIFGLGRLGIGYQVGATFVQSDLNGNVVNGLQNKARDQQFFTAGLFRRAHDGYGLQGGFVYDYMHDNFWAKYSVAQIRVEIGYLTFEGHEFGFWGAFSIHDGHDVVTPGGAGGGIGAGTPLGFQTIDMYNGYYRYTFDNGAQARMWLGGTDSKTGIIGSDFRLPLSNRFDLWGWYNYLIPGQQGYVGMNGQAWNLSMSLVWYPGRKACGTHNTPFRALFAPADNNWLITRPSQM